MKKNLLTSAVAAALALSAAALLVGASSASAADIARLDPGAFGMTLFASMPEALDDPTQPSFQVKPQEFDPGKTNLVQSTWLNSIGCPTDAQIAVPNATFTGVAGFAPFTDLACTVGDPKDQHNEGLLLVKTGPTGNFASATAELTRVKGITLTELGWDMRKLGASGNAAGSHCGAGAPRWNVLTDDGVGHFIGCNSPPPTTQTPSATGWIRMRWNPAAAFPPISPLTRVVRIQIVMDEGQDAGGAPDQFGAVVLDNITVNGAIVGHGAVDAD